LQLGLLVIFSRAAFTACRDCAQPALGGPAENRYTAFDTLCPTAACREAGVPQISVNLSNLTLYMRVTDLAFGGGFAIDRSFNQDSSATAAFGTGWSFSLGESITTASDGSIRLQRGNGRVDTFTSAAGASTLFAVTRTSDTLSRNSDGTYTLRTPSGIRTFSSDGRLLSMGAVTLDYSASSVISAAHYRGRTIQFAADDSGRITSISDAAGRTASFTYSSDGRLTKQTNADGQTVSYEYDSAGNVTSVTYQGGKVTITYAGDPGFVSVASVTTSDGTVRHYDIPDDPAEIRVTDANGDATYYVSNASGLLQSITDAAGNTISYSYDAAGNRTKAVNASNETSTLTYDSNSRLTGITDAANNKWSADYSTAATVRITDPNKNVWTLKYDDGQNLISVTDPQGNALTATRNSSGLITGVTDANGNARSYQYTPEGLISTFADALGNKWSYDYDGAARAATRTDPSGATLKAEYNARNRISALTAGSARTTFDYSGILHNAAGRISSYTDSFGNQVSYQYNPAGQLMSMTLPGDKTISYTYDHSGRLSSVTDWSGNFAVYRYDAAGWPISLGESGPVAIYQYDTARNLRAIVSSGPDGSAIAGYRYTFDAAGNRTGVSALEPNTSGLPLAAYTIGYDADNRPVTRGDGQNYTYDARGNLNAIQGSRNVTLSYDAFGRLQGLSGDASGSYSYDSTGLRATRNDRRYVWDLAGARPRIVAELDGGNGPIAWYVYGLGLLWKVTADGTAYFYHFDGDGNVVALSNPQKGVVNEYRYDSLGRLAAANESVENIFHARGEAGWVDDGNGLLFTGDTFQVADLGVTVPATADPAPIPPDLTPRLRGAGACFLEGVANCLFTTGRRER
jgi:YD repeat-containing protein